MVEMCIDCFRFIHDELSDVQMDNLKLRIISVAEHNKLCHADKTAWCVYSDYFSDLSLKQLTISKNINF